MVYFILVFIIIYILVFSMDRYFYISIYKILEHNELDPSEVLNSFGFYNRSIFTHKFYGLSLVLATSLLIYGFYYIIRVKRDREYRMRIRNLEEDLIKINKGDYSVEMKIEDEFSALRDEIYKIIVNLKSLEEEASRQKVTLKRDLSNIAHQLKTPITSIGFMAELIEEDGENTEIYLDRLYSEVEKLGDFTEVLLKLSKVNSSTIEYKFVKVSIYEMLEDILNVLNRQAKINVEIEGEDFFLLADEVWIYEAILNIIRNSLDHTKDSIHISMSSNPIYKSLTISDNGPGVSEEVLKKIFDRFYRGDTSMPGYGIGLNMSKSIIQGHNGRIRVYNNGGLTFEIKFYNVT